MYTLLKQKLVLSCIDSQLSKHIRKPFISNPLYLMKLVSGTKPPEQGFRTGSTEN